MTNPQGAPKVERVKKIAVIAVHGISDQKPFESARAIANLLLTQTDPNQSTYTPFNERFIRIKVAPVKTQAKINIQDFSGWNESVLMALAKLRPKALANFCFKLWQSADERGPYMRRLLTGRPLDPEDPVCKPDYLFMRDQIEAYKHSSIYDSICLEGRCTTIDPYTNVKTKVQVDIYEMYWADLSRLGSGFVRIFGELYQLLFHLGSLGCQSVDLMRAEHQVISKEQKFGNGFNIWAWYSSTQAMTGRILSLFLPILNLSLLVVALMSLPGNIPESSTGLVAAISTGLLLTIFVGYRFLHRNKTDLLSWLLLPFCLGFLIALGVEAFVAGAFNTGIELGVYRWLTLEWVALLSAIIWVILVKPYSRHRPGADTFAIAVGLLLSVPIVWLVCSSPNTRIGMTQVSLQMIEIIYLILLGGWLCFLALYFSTLVFAELAIAQIKTPSAKKTAKQAAWTARFALALPSLLFSLLTLSLWTALARLSAPLLPPDIFYKPLWFFKNVKAEFDAADFAQRLTVFSGSALGLLIIIATIAALVILLWALVPSILTEVFAPAPNPQYLEQNPKPTPKEQEAKREFTKGIGNWLNNGFLLILGPGDVIISWGIPILFLVGTIDGISLLGGNKESLLIHFFPWMKEIAKSTGPLLAVVAGLLTASATSLIAFGGRLNQISLGLRGVLDSVLDVDNYLRLHPREDNPSARIYARYVSLLRYLCHETTPDKTSYDAFVIVAHSQGTVISADLLRFLKVDPDPALAQIEKSQNVYLFTMGSPIRQLYSFAFPHLYQWAIQDPVSTDMSLKIPAHANPSPQDLLGVRTWVNTFRSGDYVGRYLWRSDRAIDQWLTVNLKEPPNQDSLSYISEDPDYIRREFCLGVGAHTHYWDKTAPEVAQEIDRLIRKA
jgi:hypothetical protein